MNEIVFTAIPLSHLQLAIGGTVVKNMPATAEDARDLSSIPGSGRSSGVEAATQSSIHAWEVPWTKEPGGL